MIQAGVKQPDVHFERLPVMFAKSIKDHAAFAAGFEQQQAGSTPPVAAPVLMHDNTGRFPVAAG